jgi:ADP-ribose pyrophosphatase YjhB (NUDIX family)
MNMSHAEYEASIQKAGVVVGCLVKQENKYLLVKENPNGKEVYNLPAGHVDAGEQLEPAAIRETKEETGYDVRLLRQIALYHETAPQSVKHIYLAEITGGVERPQEGEILEVVWKTFEEIVALEQAGVMRAPWVYDVINNFENPAVHGAITYPDRPDRNDSLFRVSLKSVILNDDGQVLVVKETGRDWWDLPGGGIEHGESIDQAIAQELKEEVSMECGFTYESILAEEPRHIRTYNLYQMRLTFLVKPESLEFSPGEDGDEVKFVDASEFEYSELITERRIFEYSELAKQRLTQ